MFENLQNFDGVMALFCRLQIKVDTGIMTPAAVWSLSLLSAGRGAHTFGFKPITLERMHQFHYGQASLNTGPV